MQQVPEIYRQKALEYVPRALGLADRLPDSETYGCFDRYYWCYKLIDFANGRLQEGALLAALAWKLPTDNPFHQNASLKNISLGACRFWSSIQRQDGSFDEAYPFEHSLVSTAFSSCAIALTLEILEESPPEIIRSLERAAGWLIHHTDVGPSNQTIGAAAALHSIGSLTKNRTFSVKAREKFRQALAGWNDEGYFLEYGGFDVGYTTIALSYMGLIARTEPWEELLETGKKAVNFIGAFVDGDCQWDYRKTSRKTQYIYPMGLSWFDGAGLLSRHADALLRGRVLQPAWMDDRYSIPMAIDYLLLEYLSCK